VATAHVNLSFSTAESATWCGGFGACSDRWSRPELFPDRCRIWSRLGTGRSRISRQ